MKDDIKVMARALCIMSLTLIVNLVFLHLIIYAAPQNGIEAIDAAGREVRFDGDGNAVNVGPVRFLFDTDRLDDGEMYLYDDGESDLLNPVEDGEYDLFPEDKDAAVSFYKRSPERDDASLLGTYHVSFKEGIFEAPKAQITECEEGILVTVYPLDNSFVYCEINGPKNGELEEITEKTDFLLDTDGEYQIAVYGEDGLGHRTYADIPSSIVLDRTGPVISASEAEIKEDRLSLLLSAADDLSGLSQVTVSKGNTVLYRGTGNKEKVIIDISRLPYGTSRYDITAYDNASNVTDEYFTVEKKDDKAPELTLKGASDKGVYGREVKIDAEASDDSGKECVLKETVSVYDLSGKYEGEETYDKKSLTFDKSGIYIIRAEASDETGNKTARSLAFAIDRKSPVIRGLMGLNGSSLKSFMIKNTEELAYDDSMVQVKMILNGMDYNGEKITKAGKYRLVLKASDELGNTNTEDIGFEIRN